tara:strand:+ start:905 stop:1537 length:633 start_codon:yes stop_codon:yes gene_type:complete
MEMPPMQDVAAACLSVILLLNVAKGYLTSSSLGSMAASPLFPVIVGALSGLNLFTLVLTAPLVLAYCTAAVVAKGRLGWLFVALCNAAGTVAGSYAMIVFMEGGTGGSVAYIKESFPAAFASQWWARTEFVVDAYGAAGAVAISSLPVILHPLIAICKLADMSTASLLYCIMLGRTIKYIIMGQVARQAPSALKYFGASADTIAKVKKSA